MMGFHLSAHKQSEVSVLSISSEFYLKCKFKFIYKTHCALNDAGRWHIQQSLNVRAANRQIPRGTVGPPAGTSEDSACSWKQEIQSATEEYKI